MAMHPIANWAYVGSSPTLNSNLTTQEKLNGKIWKKRA